VEHLTNRVAAMYLGEIVELTDCETLCQEARHPYTKALLSAVPIPDPHQRGEKIILHGDMPSPINPPTGRKFHPRCPIAQDICSKVAPEARQIGKNVDHRVAYHAVDPID
jgi:oligopeptide/dipeptide ABC transporter ATP-binding protein